MSENIPNESAFKSALKKAKKSKLWRGTIEERKQKFIALHSELNAIYGRDIKLEFIDVSANYDTVSGASGASGYIAPINTLFIVHKLSVITFIQLWIRALGVDTVSSVSLSEDIFKEIFPLSARKLVNINGLFIKASDASDNDPNNDNLSDASGDIPRSD